MSASIEYYGYLRLYVKLCTSSKFNHCNRWDGRESPRHNDCYCECNGMYNIRLIKCIWNIDFLCDWIDWSHRQWKIQMGSGDQEHNFGQLFLGLHSNRIARRTIGWNDRRAPSVRSQHVMVQCVDLVHTSCFVYWLQSSCFPSCFTWIFSRYVWIDAHTNLFDFEILKCNFFVLKNFRCVMASYSSNDSRLDSASRSIKIHG